MIRLRSIRPDGAARKLSLSTAAAVALLALASAGACGGDDTGGTPTGTGQGATGTDQPRATVPADARPATLLEDPSGFLAQYSQEILAEKNCDYNETNGVADCSKADAGLIDLVPDLPAGTDIKCRVLISKETPVGVRCTGQNPLFAAIYALEE